MTSNRGAYLLLDNTDSTLILFIYIKLSKNELISANPGFDIDTYHTENRHYLSAFFKNGTDYIGASTSQEINNLISKKNSINLLTNTYQSCYEVFNQLTKEEYDRLTSFANEQLNVRPLN